MARLISWVALALAGVIVSALVLSLWWSARQRTTATIEVARRLAPGVTQRVANFERRKFKGDRLVWEVRAEEAEYSGPAKEARVRNVSARWVHSDGMTLALGSATGVLRMSQDFSEVEELWLQGDVRVSLRGYEMRVERAEYDGRKRRVSAPGKVVVVGPGLEIEGEGLDLDVATEVLRLGGRVRMELVPERIEQEVGHATF